MVCWKTETSGPSAKRNAVLAQSSHVSLSAASHKRRECYAGAALSDRQTGSEQARDTAIGSRKGFFSKWLVRCLLALQHRLTPTLHIDARQNQQAYYKEDADGQKSTAMIAAAHPGYRTVGEWTEN